MRGRILAPVLLLAVIILLAGIAQWRSVTPLSSSEEPDYARSEHPVAAGFGIGDVDLPKAAPWEPDARYDPIRDALEGFEAVLVEGCGVQPSPGDADEIRAHLDDGLYTGAWHYVEDRCARAQYPVADKIRARWEENPEQEARQAITYFESNLDTLMTTLQSHGAPTVADANMQSMVVWSIATQ